MKGWQARRWRLAGKLLVRQAVRQAEAAREVAGPGLPPRGTPPRPPPTCVAFSSSLALIMMLEVVPKELQSG